MPIKFYRNAVKICDIRPEGSSTRHIVYMGENMLNLTFRTTVPPDLRVNDFVVFADGKYRLKSPVNPTRKSRHGVEYQLKMISPQNGLQAALYTLEDTAGIGIPDDTVPLYGTAQFHLQQTVGCACRVHPEWQVGDVEEPAAGKDIVYTGMNCRPALQHMCPEFNIEYRITGITPSPGKKKHGSPVLFRYGKGNAQYELSRTNRDGLTVTGLPVKGPDRNIGGSACGSRFLHLPDNGRYIE
jgi:hypothetical protein